MSRRFESGLVVLKKSKFKGFATSVTNPDSVGSLIEELVQSDKTIRKATHPSMYAFRIQQKNGNLAQGSSDCGEKGSGQRLLVLLTQLNLVNVLVSVTRWYGGTPLSSARFRCISQAAMGSINESGFVNKNDGNPVDFAKLVEQKK